MLSNEEIEEIDAAASPITAITAFIPVPYVAPALAAIIAGYMYWVKKQNKKDGKRGVVISVKARWAWLGWQRIPMVQSIDTW